jgi:sporulation protein YlmC with PRC-barrel domain
MHLELDELPRRPVLDATGSVVGDIAAPLVDAETWLVDTLRVRLRRSAAQSMSVPWSFVRRPTIDIPTGLIQAAGDAIILRVSMAELRDSPPLRIVPKEAAEAAEAEAASAESAF